MFFKNLTVYRLDRDWLAQLPPLADVLPDHPLREIPAMALECRGWSPEVREAEGAEQFTLLRDYRALPAGAVRRLAAERIADIEARQGFRLGRKACRQIAEEIAARMTPQVPVQRAALQAVLDRRDGWLLLNTASSARGDEFTQALRHALGSLPAVPITVEPSMASLMTRWLAGGAAPRPFALDDECQLVSRDELKATVRYVRHDLVRGDVVDHLRDGKLVQRLAMVWQDRIAFLIDDRLALRRLRFLDEALIAENRADGDADAIEQADMTLMVGMLRECLAALCVAAGVRAG